MRPAALILVVALAAAGPASGQRAQPDELRRLEAQQLDEQVRARRLRRDAHATAQEIERLRVELLRLGDGETADAAAVADQRARLADLHARETELGVRLSRERARQTRLLAALQTFRRDPPPPLLVAPDRATDAVRAQILLRAVTPVLDRRAQALVDDQRQLQRLRREAALAGEALFTAESSLAETRADLERLIAEKRALESLLDADAEAAEREARSLARRVRDMGGLLRELSEEDLDAALAAPLPGGRQSLGRPVAGPVVSGFGGGARGMTFAAEPQALVVAPADAVVEYAGPLEGWGEVAVLRLGPGWRVVLAGLGRADARIGGRVAEGEPIGRMGPAPGGELYFELRRDDRPVDPRPWLDARRPG